MSAITAKASRKMKKYAVLTREPRCFLGSFDFSWEQRKLGDVATFINGRAYSQPELLSSGKYKVLRVGNFYTNDSWYYSDLELGEKYYADYGDLLYTWSATFGPHIWLGDRVIYHYHIWKIDLSNQLEKQFAVQLLEQDKANILSSKNGSTMVHITKEGMEQKDVIIPPSTKEQQEIGAFFQQLDNLITLHQRERISFSGRASRLIPPINKKRITSSWEQRKAKELFISTADKGYPDLPVLSATQDRGMIRRDENSINIFHDKKNEAGYKRVLPGQFVIHLRSFQGGFAHSAIEGITSPAYTVFGFSEPEKHDSEYWKYVFTSKAFIRRLETVTYGIRDGRSISYDEFLTLSFAYPSKAEQTAIARYLDKLSDLITLHQRKPFFMKWRTSDANRNQTNRLVL